MHMPELSIVISSVCLYVFSLFCNFVFDDLSAIVHNKDVLPQTELTNLLWNDFWGMPMSQENSHKSYRPLTTLTFKLNYMLSEFNPWTYHLVNIFLHCNVCMLYYKLCVGLFTLFSLRSGHGFTSEKHTWKLNLGKSVNDGEDIMQMFACIASALFVVHPVHTEAVVGVVGRAELLSAIFYILTILSFLKFTVMSMIFSMACAVIAVACKEQGITVLAVCFYIDLFVLHQTDLLWFIKTCTKQLPNARLRMVCQRGLVLFFIGCIVLLWRFYVMQGSLPRFTRFDNPAAFSDFPSRHLSYNYLLPINTWLLFAPVSLLCDWTICVIPLIDGFSDIRNVATFVFWIIFILLVFSSAFPKEVLGKTIGVSIAIMVASFLPASNLFFPVGFVVAERILYIPSMGFCLLVSAGLCKLYVAMCDRNIAKVVFWSSIGLILISQSVQTVHRVLDWQSERSLFSSAIKVTLQNAKVWNNMGHTYESEKNWTEAIKYFLKATRVQPDDLGAYMNVAGMYSKLGKTDLAEEYFWKAKQLLPQPIPGKPYTTRIAPNHLNIFVKLANIIKENETRLAEADALYREAIQMRPSFADAYINRGEILVKLGRFKDALESYNKALHLSSTPADVYFNIGVVYSQQGNKTGALEAYTYAIHHNKDHVKALYNSASILQQTRDRELLVRAKSRVLRVIQLESNNTLARSLLGSICMDMSDNDEAIAWWKSSLQITPDQKTSLFNIALLYSRMGKIQECMAAIEDLFEYHPHHEKGLMLYGDLMLNSMQNVHEAKRAYEKIVVANPGNVQAQHNLCVIIFKENRLVEAERCLASLAHSAPHETYITENLLLLRKQIAEEERRRKSEDRKLRFRVDEDPADERSDDFQHTARSKFERDDTIYVATKQQRRGGAGQRGGLVARADKIMRELNEFIGAGAGGMDEKLSRAVEAVRALRDIKSQILEGPDAERCSRERHAAKVEKARVNALAVLDEIESKLL